MAISRHVSRAMLEHYSHIRLQAKRPAVEALDTFKPPAELNGRRFESFREYHLRHNWRCVFPGTPDPAQK
jgi:hypothetical protein